MNEGSKEAWSLLRNNNGEWVSETRILVVHEDVAQKLEDLAMRCGVTLSRQASMGIMWFYRHEVEKLEDSLSTDGALLEAYTNAMDAEGFQQNLTKAGSGDASAQCQVGFCYRFGIGVEEDEWEAVKWLGKAAMQGVADAQFLLGDCYRDGEGVRKNDWLAIMWLKKAAEQGNEAAKGLLANYGSTGVEDWLKAAENGDVEAQYSAGVCHYYGTGLPQDHGEAVHWLRKAAEQDDHDAQMLLVRCYLHGTGVPKDLDKAEMWLNAARQHGKSHG